MKNRFLSLLCVLALCLGLLPVTALAAEGAPSQLYVGNQQVISGNDITYWTTDASGGLGSASGDSWNVKYDPACATLTLNGATIKGGSDVASIPYGAGIYALSSSNQPVALTIELIGENTITGTFGIYVNATPPTTPGTDASLVIKKSGDNGNNGSLTATGTVDSGLYIISGTGDASLTINDASVVASSSASYGCAGVCVQSGASATDSPNISLAVDGGNLTTSASEGNDGIQFYVGSSEATGATTSLTVSDNAIVDAKNGGISASRISVTLPTPTPTGDNRSGIVFDGSTGTVYGTVELQNDLTINEGETLTVPDGSSLSCNGKLTNNGTILASGGTVSGNLSDGSTVTTPSISQQPTGQTVTEGSAAMFSVTASNAQTYQWQQSTDNGSSWANIESATSASYTISSTATDMSNYQYRCVVKSASGVGVISQAATLTVNKGVSPTSYSISANVAPAGAGTVKVNGSGTSATVEANSDVTLTATANEGYRFTGWTSSDGGTFTDASSESTTFTMPAGNVTVTAQFAKVVTGVKLDKETLALYTGDSATLTATVEPSDAANQNVTWQSNNANVATVQNGTVTAVGAGETTITVQTQDGNYTATCHVTVTQSTYSISADTTALNFGSVYTGYAQPAAKEVTITNTGNRPQTLTLTASTGSFEVGTLTKTQLAAGEKATFTVQPKAGLAVGTYSENITVSGTGGATVTITANFTVKQYSSGGGTPTKTPSQQATDKIESAKEGSTVEITLRTGQTKLDKEVFEALAGRDVTLEISLPGGVSWTVNGQDIPENTDLTDLDMGVSLNTSTIPVNLINSVTGEAGTVQLTLKHNGEFGFTMTLTAPVGVKNAGLWANLYHYDEDAGKMVYQTAALVDEDGNVALPFDHASQYALVLDSKSHDLPFTDLAANAWYTDAVAYVYRHDLMAGYGENLFGPDDDLSRAQLCQIIYNMEGQPATSGSSVFTDVADGAWYADAVTWAASQGIVGGYGNGLFGPEDNITREQLASILYRYAQSKGYDTSVGENTNILSYTDALEISEYAIPAMQWACGAGIMEGNAGYLTPQGDATRAQVATMLMRFCENYATTK